MAASFILPRQLLPPIAVMHGSVEKGMQEWARGWTAQGSAKEHGGGRRTGSELPVVLLAVHSSQLERKG